MCKKFILNFELCPGDIVAATALVRDIKLTYPDILLDFKTNIPEIFENNPYLTKIDIGDADAKYITLDYQHGITLAKKEKLHFITYFHKYFELQTGLKVPVLFSKPDIHLSKYEQLNSPISGRYWLVMGGGKPDMTTKHWEYTRYQEVVTRLRHYGIKFVQTGSDKHGHTHPPINNALNLVGWGGIRHLIWQIAHCDGIICPITCGMHIAAALDKPCVVIAGGREEPWWEAYVNSFNAFGPAAAPIKIEHKYLHTFDLLKCCSLKGCWKRKVIRKGNEDVKETFCELPVLTKSDQTIPECLNMITVDHVVEAVMDYYNDKTLAPIGLNKDATNFYT